MISIADKEKYLNYQKTMEKLQPKKRVFVELILPCLIYASIGAITWAIRGTGGWGGSTGALVPGLTWGVLWYYFSYKRGIDTRGMSFWMGISVAIGGFWGYGQYHTWIRGTFVQISDPMTLVDVNPIWGYLWFFVIGANWLGITGIIVGWAIENKNENLSINEKLRKWIPRLIIPTLFALTVYLIKWLFPQLLYPLWDESFYTEAVCPVCVNRTEPLNTANSMAFMWWIGACVTALIQKDKNTFICGTFLGIGYGFLYILSAASSLGDQINSAYIDWWKIWELNAGLTAGILFAVLQYWLLKKFDEQVRNITNENYSEDSKIEKTKEEKFLPENIVERRANLFSVLMVTILLFEIIYGVTRKLGVLLELYEDSLIEQQEMPLARLVLFLPGALILLYWTLNRLIKIFKESKSKEYALYSKFNVKKLDEKLNALFGLIVLVGAVSAWPTEIGVIYVFYYVIASMAFWRYLRYVKN